jgi:4-hydroxy-3-polyprenylbenzoate decarboxylase
MPGVLAVKAVSYQNKIAGERSREKFCDFCKKTGVLENFPLIVLCDDSEFTAKTLNNFLWITFTRSNPAADVSGVGSFVSDKHWGCFGPLIIDARIKPHHAPPLIEDPEITRKIDKLGTEGHSLHGVI